MAVASDTSTTPHAIVQETKHKSFGELIEEILTDEFIKSVEPDKLQNEIIESK